MSLGGSGVKSHTRLYDYRSWDHSVTYCEFYVKFCPKSIYANSRSPDAIGFYNPRSANLRLYQ